MANRIPPGRKKGTPKTGGRLKGTRNKATIEAKQMARTLVDDPAYIFGLKERLHSGQLAPAVETMLWHYAHGKPVERHEHAVGATFADLIAESQREADE